MFLVNLSGNAKGVEKLEGRREKDNDKQEEDKESEGEMIGRRQVGRCMRKI
jgi:hypothetical protein